MKKFLLILTIICLLLLCSCRRINQPDDVYYSNNNSSDISSDFSYVTSDYYSSTLSDTTISSLPERDAPTSSNSSTSNQDVVTSYGELDNTAQTNIDVSTLTIESTDAFYTNTTNRISFTVFNSKQKSFTYFTDFFLQKYQNGKWEYLETKNRIIDYKFETATSTSSVEFISINVKDLYNAPLPTGSYRIIQESDYGTLISNEFSVVIEEYFTNLEE